MMASSDGPRSQSATLAGVGRVRILAMMVQKRLVELEISPRAIASLRHWDPPCGKSLG
jgi:hypothetical protein